MNSDIEEAQELLIKDAEVVIYGKNQRKSLADIIEEAERENKKEKHKEYDAMVKYVLNDKVKEKLDYALKTNIHYIPHSRCSYYCYSGLVTRGKVIVRIENPVETDITSVPGLTKEIFFRIQGKYLEDKINSMIYTDVLYYGVRGEINHDGHKSGIIFMFTTIG